MTTVDAVRPDHVPNGITEAAPAQPAPAVLDAVGVETDEMVQGRMDGMSTFLQMLGRVCSPAGAWSEGTGQIDTAMTDVLRVAVASMPDACAATVVQVRQGKVVTMLSTEQTGQDVDAAQQAARQGPAVQAAADDTMCFSSNLSTDERWPDLAAAAAGLTVRSVICQPLAASGLPHAVLIVYSERVAAWPPDASSRGLPAAVLAGTCLALGALKRQSRIDNLQIALESNRTIGAAVGVVMSALHCTAEQAFDRIRTASQNHNLKLRDLAEDVLRTGSLTDSAPEPSSATPPDLGEPLGLPSQRDRWPTTATLGLTR